MSALQPSQTHEPDLCHPKAEGGRNTQHLFIKGFTGYVQTKTSKGSFYLDILYGFGNSLSHHVMAVVCKIVL